MNIQWELKRFDELTGAQMYAILQVRSLVFVVEQNCAYHDMDDKDQHSWHLMGWSEDGRLAAYTRLVPAGLSFTEHSIGRVITAPFARGHQAGVELVRRSIDAIYNIWGKVPIRIGAQLYLKRFYEKAGFQQVSKIFLEDGIEHIEMLLSPAK